METEKKKAGIFNPLDFTVHENTISAYLKHWKNPTWHKKIPKMYWGELLKEEFSLFRKPNLSLSSWGQEYYLFTTDYKRKKIESIKKKMFFIFYEERE